MSKEKEALVRQKEETRQREKRVKIAAWKAEKEAAAKEAEAAAQKEQDEARKERKRRGQLEQAEKRNAVAIFRLRRDQEAKRAAEANRIAECQSGGSRGKVHSQELLELYERDVARVREQKAKRDKLEADRWA